MPTSISTKANFSAEGKKTVGSFHNARQATSARCFVISGHASVLFCCPLAPWTALPTCITSTFSTLLFKKRFRVFRCNSHIQKALLFCVVAQLRTEKKLFTASFENGTGNFQQLNARIVFQQCKTLPASYAVQHGFSTQTSRISFWKALQSTFGCKQQVYVSVNNSNSQRV